MSPDELVIQYHNLPYYLVNKYHSESYNRPSYMSIEDLYQTAQLSLVRASRSYRDDRGTNFKSWASVVILNDLKLIYRKPNRHYESLDQLLGDSVADLSNFIKAPDDTEAAGLDSTICKDLVVKFSPRQHDILRLLLAGLRQRQIGVALGRTRSQISREVKNMRLILKPKYKRENKR